MKTLAWIWLGIVAVALLAAVVWDFRESLDERNNHQPIFGCSVVTIAVLVLTILSLFAVCAGE